MPYLVAPVKAISMTLHKFHPGTSANRERGFTLLELIIAATILSILTLMALPLARITIQREKEKELRKALWDMRDAIEEARYEREQAARVTGNKIAMLT